MSKIGQCSFPLFKDYPYIEKLSMLKGIPLIPVLFFQVVKKLEGQDVGDFQITWESWQVWWGPTPVHVMYVCKELTQPKTKAD